MEIILKALKQTEDRGWYKVLHLKLLVTANVASRLSQLHRLYMKNNNNKKIQAAKTIKKRFLVQQPLYDWLRLATASNYFPISHLRLRPK